MFWGAGKAVFLAGNRRLTMQTNMLLSGKSVHDW